MTFLTDDPLDEAKKIAREAFLVFEHREGSKMVDEREIPTVIRSMGINPNASHLESFSEKLRAGNGEDTQFITLENFEKVMARILVEEKEQLMRDDFHRIMSAFRAIDMDGLGYIEAETMKTLMTTEGEPMNEEEINVMMSSCCDEDGRIYYEDYAYLLAADGRSI